MHLTPLLTRTTSDETQPWQRGYCPVCGAWPLLAEVRHPDPGRTYRCGGCGFAWSVPRPACPYCGNDDHTTRPTLASATEAHVEISACDRCRGFVKVAASVAPMSVAQTPTELLSFDDLASGQLDRLAIERGYHRPARPGFPIELAVADDELSDDLS